MLRKKLVVGVLIFAIVLVATVKWVLPRVVLNELNDHFATFSPVYSLHIAGLELHILRMAYSFDDLEAKFKKDGEVFARVKRIDVAIAWSELIHARVLTNVGVDGGVIALSKEVIGGAKEKPDKTKADARDVGRKLFPVDVASVSLDHTEIDFSKLIDQPRSEGWKLSKINALVLNLTPHPGAPETFLTLNAAFLDQSTLKAAGKLLQLDKPLAWKFDFELHGLDLPSANPILLRTVPMSFDHGTLDAYAEVRSRKGELQGYVKPFFKDLKLLQPDQHFKGAMHFFIEVATAVSNVILRKADNKTVATKVPFHMEDGKLKVDIPDAVSNAVQHGFGDPIAPGIEDSLKL